MPSNWAVLCPGPSLDSTFDRDFCGPRIGVNDAVNRYRCDFWCAGDPAAPPAYPIRLFTRADWEAVGDRFPDSGVRWQRFSATAALILAACYGARRIQVYGADMRPAPGDDPELRSAERFADELVIWRRTCEMLSARDTAVVRL